MAMSSDAAATTLLSTAADGLRARVEQRWVEVADAVMSKVLATDKPSWPVLAQQADERTGAGLVHVGDRVLIAYLRDSIDPVPDCEVVTIQVHTSGDVCTGIVITLAVRYGAGLLPLADQVRKQAERRLGQLLGPTVPAVRVRDMHVHVADVTRHDPKL
ncbi:MAG: hypothetical protein M3Q87_08320 [Actinomycetota bacterium]|nr:hypothetical protein [Actinomycetota bacterium]